MDICGSWTYGLSEEHGGRQYLYHISQAEAGQLCFEQDLPSGGKVTGRLQRDGLWLQTELFRTDGSHYGELRLRHNPGLQEIVTNLRRAGEVEWGEDVKARKVSNFRIDRISS